MKPRKPLPEVHCNELPRPTEPGSPPWIIHNEPWILLDMLKHIHDTLTAGGEYPLELPKGEWYSPEKFRDLGGERFVCSTVLDDGRTIETTEPGTKLDAFLDLVELLHAEGIVRLPERMKMTRATY